jgi:hypothetical protein
LYSQFGIAECWVIDLNNQRTLVYLCPVHSTFQRTSEYLAGDAISPMAIPKLTVAVSDLFAWAIPSLSAESLMEYRKRVQQIRRLIELIQGVGPPVWVQA